MDVISEEVKLRCKKEVKLTNNQIKLMTEIVTYEGTLDSLAKNLGISQSSLHSTLNRIELKCPGFRKRLKNLRTADLEEVKVFPIASINSDMLSNRDIEKLHAAGLYPYDDFDGGK